MDVLEIHDTITAVVDDYEYKRIEELLSTQKGNSRIRPNQMEGILGKAQACRELKTLLFNAFGFDV